VVKIPGDIVWERARNVSATKLNISDFQTSKLPARYRLMRRLFSYAINSSSLVIVPSTELRNLSAAWGAKNSQTEIIYNSVRISKIPNRVIDPQFDFITVARLVPWKGIESVIKEVCNLGLKLLIVGDGPERKKLETVAREFPGLVQFAGEISPGEVRNWLMKAKFFILNSSFEATSYALLEAMSLGLVPIANSGTGSEEVIQHGVTGFLCGEDTGMNLQTAISLLSQDFEKAHEMREAAWNAINEGFNLEKNYLRILDRCLREA